MGMRATCPDCGGRVWIDLGKRELLAENVLDTVGDCLRCELALEEAAKLIRFGMMVP